MHRVNVYCVLSSVDSTLNTNPDVGSVSYLQFTKKAYGHAVIQITSMHFATGNLAYTLIL